MKNLLSYISLVLLVAYTVSTMGFGVHECTKRGTKDVVVLLSGDPCKSLHSEESFDDCNAKTACGCCGCCAEKSADSSHNAVHSAGCCSTDVYVLSGEQVNSQQIYAEAPLASVIDILYSNNIHSKLMLASSPFSEVRYPSGFINIGEQCCLLVFTSQFRI